ncbi:MAG TPA: ribosome maturation factor RimM [Bacilli bacterium]|nr:ribosome maturation factor RimM [Bacilli bacterium]
MDFLYLGEIVNTHGIKGEIRIISDFKYKSDVFKIGNNLYIGKEKDQEIINSYRVHKNYDMVTLKGINDINDVLKYKGKKVYINRDEFKFDGILYEDIIGLDVYSDDKKIGYVSSIVKSSAHPILVVIVDKKEKYIPYIDEFIMNVDLDKKRIDVKLIKGLINED